jgi:hypothetical protein
MTPERERTLRRREWLRACARWGLGGVLGAVVLYATRGGSARATSVCTHCGRVATCDAAYGRGAARCPLAPGLRGRARS